MYRIEITATCINELKDKLLKITTNFCSDNSFQGIENEKESSSKKAGEEKREVISLSSLESGSDSTKSLPALSPATPSIDVEKIFQNAEAKDQEKPKKKPAKKPKKESDPINDVSKKSLQGICATMMPSKVKEVLARFGYERIFDVPESDIPKLIDALNEVK